MSFFYTITKGKKEIVVVLFDFFYNVNGDTMQEYIIKTREDGTCITVSQVHKILLQILKDVDELCRKYEIPYWLTGGSALGAVRHKGFIPWDDDADIGMMYEDYVRFLKVVNELPDIYCAQCFDTHKEYNVTVPAMKIRKKGTHIEEKNPLLKNKCKDCDGIFIDIFIIDYASENKVNDGLHRLMNTSLMYFIIFLENMHLNPLWLKQKYVRHARRYGKKNKGSSLIGYDLTWSFQSIASPIVYPYDSVFPIKYVPFEDTMLPIPHNPTPMLNREISIHHMSYPPLKDQKPKHIKDITF